MALLELDLIGTLNRTAAPAVRPVTLDEFKSRIDILDDNSLDAELWGLIDQATEAVESDSERALLTQTWTLTLDDFPCGDIELRRCPVLSVTHLKYYTDDVLTTWASTNYEVDSTSEPARIRPVDGVSWPSVDNQLNGVIVTFQAGYTTVPHLAKAAVLLAARQMFYGCAEMGPGYWAMIQRLSWRGPI